MKILFILLLFGYSNIVVAELTDQQKRILVMAYDKGSTIGHPTIVQGIVMQETHAGKINGGNRDGMRRFKPHDRPVGLMQVKPAAAQHVMNEQPYMQWRWFRDIKRGKKVPWSRIRKLLLKNDVAALEFGTAYFLIMLRKSKGNVSKALASYNLGYGNGLKLSKPHKHRYVRRVKKWINNEIAELNKVENTNSEAYAIQNLF